MKRGENVYFAMRRDLVHSRVFGFMRGGGCCHPAGVGRSWSAEEGAGEVKLYNMAETGKGSPSAQMAIRKRTLL